MITINVIELRLFSFSIITFPWPSFSINICRPSCNSNNTLELMSKEKFYVVWKGKKPGIYTSWNDCQKQIKGFDSARFKSFKTHELAQKAFGGNSDDYIGDKIIESGLTAIQLQRIGKPILDSLAVDAASSSSTNEVEYRGVYVKTGKVIFLKGPYKDGTNNIGEFLALIHAIAYCKQRKIELPIYSDSRTAISWVKNKKAKTKLTPTLENGLLFDLVDRALKWLKTNAYPNKILKWETRAWGEIPADFGRK